MRIGIKYNSQMEVDNSIVTEPSASTIDAGASAVSFQCPDSETKIVDAGSSSYQDEGDLAVSADTAVGAGSVAGEKPSHAIVLPQVVVNNVFKHSSAAEFEAYLTKTHALAFRKVRKVPQKNFAFVTFDSDADMQLCISKLNGAVFRKDKLHVAVRSHVMENRGDNDGSKKRGGAPNQPSEGDSSVHKRPRAGGEGVTSDAGSSGASPPPPRSGRDVASPWADIPYPTQLQRKTEAMRMDCIGRTVKEVLKTYKVQGIDKRHMPSWLTQKDDSFGIKFNNIIYSNDIVGYRNKCEFTFGLSVLDQKPCVGFRVATFQGHGDHGSANSEGGAECSSMRAEIGSVADCPNVPNAMKLIASVFNSFLTTTPLQCYNMRTHVGVWRNLTLRYSRRTRQMVLMLCVQLEGVDGALWQAELDRLAGVLQAVRRDEFTDVEGDGSKLVTSMDSDHSTESTSDTDRGKSIGTALVTGFCLQVFNGLSVPSSDHPVSTVFGKPFIEEELLGCTFRVSPQAFFQVNAPVAELLFAHAIDMMTADFGEVSSASSSTTSASNPSHVEPTDDSTPLDASTASALPSDAGTVCLDVCCGTGTIGICIAADKAIRARNAIKSAAVDSTDLDSSLRPVSPLGVAPVAVIGVDLCAPAIEDAWDNAARNGILPIMERDLTTPVSDDSNRDTATAAGNGGRAFFIATRAEALMEGLLYSGGWRGCNGSVRPGEAGALSAEEQRRLHGQLCRLRTWVTGKRLAAIVDPPREGLHGDCLRAIRNCRRIDRLVYVSCNPTGSFPHDAALLCSPVSKRMHGDPFIIVAATPVDLFPNTPHCEMVVVFERRGGAVSSSRE